MTINELIEYRGELVALHDRLEGLWYGQQYAGSISINEEEFVDCIGSVRRCIAFLDEMDIELPDISMYAQIRKEAKNDRAENPGVL